MAPNPAPCVGLDGTPAPWSGLRGTVEVGSVGDEFGIAGVGAGEEVGRDGEREEARGAGSTEKEFGGGGRDREREEVGGAVNVEKEFGGGTDNGEAAGADGEGDNVVFIPRRLPPCPFPPLPRDLEI